MKTIFLTIVSLLSLIIVESQNFNQYLEQNDSLSYSARSLDQSYLKIGVGYWLPKGELSNFIDNSPLFELVFVVPESKKNRSFEAGIQLVVPEQKNFFVLTDNRNEFDIETTSIVNGYIKLNKYIIQKPKARLSLGISLGISSIFVDALDSAGNDVLDYDSINSVLVAPGLAYDISFNDNSMLQLSVDVQYTPFKMERAVTKDLSSFTLLPKLSYRF